MQGILVVGVQPKIAVNLHALLPQEGDVPEVPGKRRPHACGLHGLQHIKDMPAVTVKKDTRQHRRQRKLACQRLGAAGVPGKLG